MSVDFIKIITAWIIVSMFLLGLLAVFVTLIVSYPGIALPFIAILAVACSVSWAVSYIVER